MTLVKRDGRWVCPKCGHTDFKRWVNATVEFAVVSNPDGTVTEGFHSEVVDTTDGGHTCQGCDGEVFFPHDVERKYDYVTGYFAVALQHTENEYIAFHPTLKEAVQALLKHLTLHWNEETHGAHCEEKDIDYKDALSFFCERSGEYPWEIYTVNTDPEVGVTAAYVSDMHRALEA